MVYDESLLVHYIHLKPYLKVINMKVTFLSFLEYGGTVMEQIPNVRIVMSAL